MTIDDGRQTTLYGLSSTAYKTLFRSHLMQSPEKPTKLGTTSFILAIVVVVLWCIYFALFAAMTEGGATFGMDGTSSRQRAR